WQVSLMLVLKKKTVLCRVGTKTRTYQRDGTTGAGKAGVLCTQSGIARHLTVARTPQQNGLAECMNESLMDKDIHRMLRVFGRVAYSQVKQAKLEPRADSSIGTDKFVEELQVEMELQGRKFLMKIVESYYERRDGFYEEQDIRVSRSSS
ncbi:retrovirus-related pol polyprotein from transposon TNT 1-94, partial [Tanacetum coccineum]